MNWFKRAEGEGEVGFRHLKRWRTPSNYFGAEWDGWYAAPVRRHRDSEILDNSNWEVQLERIPESETVQAVTESHFAVGWVEWLAIHESDRGALAEAEKIGEQLENYPILDEDHYSQLEWKTMEESGMIHDPNSGEWVDEVEGEWKGRLEGISIPGMDGVTASGEFIITYMLNRKELKVTNAKPIYMEVKKPRGRVVVVTNGNELNPGGIVKRVMESLMEMGSEAHAEKVFDQMRAQLESKYF